MKGAVIALAIGIILLFALYEKANIYNTSGTFDIHLHDTYYVLSYSTVVVFVLLFLGTLFSAGGLIASGFKSKGFWIAMVLFLFSDTYYIRSFYLLFQDVETTSTFKQSV